MKVLCLLAALALFTSSTTAQCMAKITPEGLIGGDGIGTDIDVSGDWLIVGASTSDISGVDSGTAWIFRKDAAGAWSEQALVGPHERLGLRQVKGQLLRLKGARLLRQVVRSPDVYLIRRGNGELLVGATMEEKVFEGCSSAGAVLDLAGVPRYDRRAL